MRILILVLLVVGVASCRSGGYSGSGPIQFSDGVLRNYDNYISRETPMSFAVTEDGKNSFYYYCPWNYQGHCEALADTQIIYQCEKRHKSKCLVFARGKQIVWDNPGDWRGGVPDGQYKVDHNKRQSSDNSVQPVPAGRGTAYAGSFFGEGATPRSEGNVPGPKICERGEVYPVTARYYNRVVSLVFDFTRAGGTVETMSGKVSGSKFSFEADLFSTGSGFVVNGTVGGRTIDGRVDSHSCASRFQLSATS